MNEFSNDFRTSQFSTKNVKFTRLPTFWMKNLIMSNKGAKSTKLKRQKNGGNFENKKQVKKKNQKH